jgi:hypothetical protein
LTKTEKKREEGESTHANIKENHRQTHTRIKQLLLTGSEGASFSLRNENKTTIIIIIIIRVTTG